MKKILTLLIVLSMFLSGCTTLPQSTPNHNNTDGSSSTGQTSKDGTTPSPGDDAAVTVTPTETQYSTGASVEELVSMAKDFIDALYLGSKEELPSFCKGDFKEKVEKEPDTYIRTKTSYNIDKIDASLKPLGDNNYSVTTVVYATGKTDKNKKGVYSYTVTIEKDKDTYYVVDFKQQ